MPYTRAQLLAAYRQDHPELAKVEDNKLFAAIAQDSPEIARGASEFQAQGQAPDARSAGQVAYDQAGNVVQGAIGAVTGIPKMIGDIVGGKGTFSELADAISKPMQPIIKTTAPGFFGPTTQQDWEQGAQAAGGNAAGLVLGKVGDMIIGAEPDALMTKAANARAAVAKMRGGEDIPTSKTGIVTEATKAVARPVVNAGASAIEKIAKLKALRESGPVAPTALNFPETDTPPVSTTNIVTKDSPAMIAADERSRIAQAGVPDRSPITPATPVNQPAPQNLGQEADLNQMRQQTEADNTPDPELQVPPGENPASANLPESVWDRQSSVPGSPGFSISPASAGQPVRPDIPRGSVTREIPEGYSVATPKDAPGFSGPLAPGSSEYMMMKAGINPSGFTAARSTLRNLPYLTDAVPELRNTPPGRMFDQKLMNGYNRAISERTAADQSVPQDTPVPTADMVKQLTELEGKYADQLQNSSVRTIAKVKDGLQELGPSIPWSQFQKIKQGFFNEVRLSSAAGGQAYQVFKQALEKISPDLAAANQKYFTVKTALENAKIDPATGLRIMDKGPKPIKPTPGKGTFPGGPL